MHTARKLPAFLFGLLVLISLLALRAVDPPFMSAQRGLGFDTLQRLWPRADDPEIPVRIVDIDEKSLAELGQWPWNRDILSRLTNELSDLGAAAIVFDMVFPEADRLSPKRMMENYAASAPPGPNAANPDVISALPDYDYTFANALRGRPTVLAFASRPGPPASSAPAITGVVMSGAPALAATPRLGSIISNLPILENAAAGIGSISIDLASAQGIARQIPMLWNDGTRFYPSLSIEALRVAQGADTLVVNAAQDTENAIESVVVGNYDVPLAENGQFLVHYRDESSSHYVSAADVVSGKNKDQLSTLINGNIIFIGTSATGLADMRVTPLGQSVPGVSIHAQATEQMLTSQFLQRPEWAAGLELVFLAVCGVVLIILGNRLAPMASMLATSVALALVLAAVVLAFHYFGLLLDATYPLLALAILFLANTAFRLLVTDRQGREIRRVFSHYVAPSVLAEIEKNPGHIKLGGEVRDVTVMFVDIANFTPLSEKLSPALLVSLVNSLWDVCSRAILAEQGTIDKFIGDGVMAFWNAPIAQPDHQLRAASAALRIRDALAGFNSSPEIAAMLNSQNCPQIELRIGLASGPACVGNMGSSERFDYSVLGETVNVAARAEQACKHVGHGIVIAGEIAVESQSLALLHAGFALLKGKSRPVPIHVLLGNTLMAKSHSFDRLKRDHDTLVQELASARSKAKRHTLSLLTEELIKQYPDFKTYLDQLPARVSDFATPTT